MPGVVHPVPTMKHTIATPNNRFDKIELHCGSPLDQNLMLLQELWLALYYAIKTAERTGVGGLPNDPLRESSARRSEQPHARYEWTCSGRGFPDRTQRYRVVR